MAEKELLGDLRRLPVERFKERPVKLLRHAPSSMGPGNRDRRRHSARR